MVPPAVIAHFNRAAAGYTGRRGTWPLSRLREREQEAVRALADVRAGQLVLDAGCGDGATLAWLRQVGTRAVGIDIASAMAATCRLHGFAVSVQDMASPALRPLFDRVLCVGSLEFAPDPGATLRGLAHCLRPGGRLVLLFPRRGWAGRLYAAYHRRHGISVRCFYPAEIDRLLDAAGLQPTGYRRGGALSSAVAAISPPDPPTGSGSRNTTRPRQA